MQAIENSTLGVRLLSRGEATDHGHGRWLAVVRYGCVEPGEPGSPAGRSAGPCVPLPVLGSGPEVEAWVASGPVLAARRGGVELASDARLLFGHVRRSDADPARLEAATLEAFREVLMATASEGYPELLRVWASVPRINEEETTEEGERLERYKAFCRGRGAAFEEAWGHGFTRRLPASTAVGSATGEFVVHFLSAGVPGVHVENPRQVAAYLYPRSYGPTSPSFARATRLPDALGSALFVSGTASIVGHGSLHPDSLAEQTRETVRNLERVREAAERPGAGPGRLVWSLFKVYLRRAEDEAEARRLLAELTGGRVPTLFLRADVCRHELLIEIEAVAVPGPA